MEIKTKEELIATLTELETRMATLQEIVDNLQPAKEEETPEETPEELSDEEVSEIDKLLQED